MQVKKFEAKSMKEALEMVKMSLGPEAIILSAKDFRGGFGLKGESSVQVTAAVTDEMIQKKNLAEQRLNEINRERYTKAPAARQRQFIDQVVNQYQKEQEQKQKVFTRTPYLDIGDDHPAESSAALQAEQVRNPFPQAVPASMIPAAQPVPQATQQQVNVDGEELSASAQDRIKDAAQRALSGAAGLFDEPEVQPQPQKVRKKAVVYDNGEKVTEEISSLRNEIKRLKSLVKDFQPVPQNFVNMHPGADEGIHYDLSFLYEKLINAGIAKDFLVSALKQAQDKLPPDQVKKKAFVNAWMAQHIMSHTRVAEGRTNNKYHVFMGPSGHGKTASLVKLASHMVICEKKSVAIVTTDSQKVGAAEQLKIYAQILNVPFAIIRRKSDWQVLEKKLAKVDHILVDFPGMNLKSISETDFIRSIMPPKMGGRSVHYVQSVLARDEDAYEIASRYKMIGFDDVIFTNLDETTHHGLIFNFQEKFDTPLHSFGIGSSIPEDIEPATKERIVDLIFKITKFKKSEGAND